MAGYLGLTYIKMAYPETVVLCLQFLECGGLHIQRIILTLLVSQVASNKSKFAVCVTGRKNE